MSEWKPIETAPKDGTIVLTYYDGWYNVAEWMGGLGWWNGDMKVFPTHWMPLPEPPND